MHGVHLMRNQEATRWQHNHIYPQPISLCECTIVMYDCVKITCVVRMCVLYHAHGLTFAGRVHWLIVVYLRNVKIPG